MALDALERIEMAIRVDVAHLLGEREPCAHENPACLHGNFAKNVSAHHSRLWNINVLELSPCPSIWPKLNYERNRSDTQHITIKLEIDTNPPVGSVSETHVLDYPYLFQLLHRIYPVYLQESVMHYYAESILKEEIGLILFGIFKNLRNRIIHC